MILLSGIVSNLALAAVLALAAWFVQHHRRQFFLARILWAMVLVKLVTPPLITVPLLTSSVTACELGTCGCPQHQSIGWLNDARWLGLALTVWAGGAMASAWYVGRHWIRLERLLGFAMPADEELRSLADRLAAEISLRRPPRVLLVPARLPPLVVPGWRRPRLVLPAGLMAQLDPWQRSALILHELTHLQRGDHLMRLVEVLVGIVYWFLPVGRLVGKQLRSCEEACCDAAVVDRLPQARRAYAQLLLDVLDFIASPAEVAPQATTMAVACDLELRLRAILNRTTTPRSSRASTGLVLALAIAILPCGFSHERIALAVETRVAEQPGSRQHEALTPDSQIEKHSISALCCPS